MFCGWDGGGKNIIAERHVYRPVKHTHKKKKKKMSTQQQRVDDFLSFKPVPLLVFGAAVADCVAAAAREQRARGVALAAAPAA